MPPVFRFYIRQCAIGFAIAGLFVGAVLWLNVGNLWHLISTSDVGLMALVVFWLLNGIVFAGVQNAVAVMMMAEPEGDGPKGGAPAHGVPVTANARA